jgi:PAS domain S-box-containing protein
MKWIRDRAVFLNGKPLQVKNPDEEKLKALNRIQRYQPVGNQFTYAMSYFSDELIYLSEGVEKLLGFGREQIKSVSFFYDLIHPDDAEMVKDLTIQAINAGSGKYRINPWEHVFHITFRMQRSDGSYINVQRQTGMLTKNEDHVMLTSFGIFTDVTHLTNSEEVQALMSGPEIRNYRFEPEGDDTSPQFTRREKEIIEKLSAGLSSEEIAQDLFISVNTVNTHRRNILRKAGVKNSAGLMAYIFKNGY